MSFWVRINHKRTSFMWTMTHLLIPGPIFLGNCVIKKPIKIVPTTRVTRCLVPQSSTQFVMYCPRGLGRRGHTFNVLSVLSSFLQSGPVLLFVSRNYLWCPSLVLFLTRIWYCTHGTCCLLLLGSQCCKSIMALRHKLLKKLLTKMRLLFQAGGGGTISQKKTFSFFLLFKKGASARVFGRAEKGESSRGALSACLCTSQDDDTRALSMTLSPLLSN